MIFRNDKTSYLSYDIGRLGDITLNDYIEQVNEILKETLAFFRNFNSDNTDENDLITKRLEDGLEILRKAEGKLNELNPGSMMKDYHDKITLAFENKMNAIENIMNLLHINKIGSEELKLLLKELQKS